MAVVATDVLFKCEMFPIGNSGLYGGRWTCASQATGNATGGTVTHPLVLNSNYLRGRHYWYMDELKFDSDDTASQMSLDISIPSDLFGPYREMGPVGNFASNMVQLATLAMMNGAASRMSPMGTYLPGLARSFFLGYQEENEQAAANIYHRNTDAKRYSVITEGIVLPFRLSLRY